MKWKTTLILLVAAVGIGAYISLYEIRQPDPEDRERRSRQVVAIAPHDVTALAVSRQGTTVRLSRTGESWMLEPSGVRADPDRAGQILTVLESLIALRILHGSPERPLEPAQFGLEPTALTLTVTTPEAVTALEFGAATAVQDNRYARLAGDAGIFTVPSGLFRLLDQPEEAFRDPLLLRVPAWEVSGASVRATERTVTLAKTDRTWRLTQPLEDLADRTEVTTWLNRIGAVRIERFVADALEPSERAKYGLEPPATEIVLTHGEPAATTTLSFGFRVPTAQDPPPAGEAPPLVYAVRSDEPAVYAVRQSAVETLVPDPHSLRERRVFDFFSSQATKTALQRGELTWTVERAEDGWREGAGGESLDATRVETWLNQLADLRLAGFVEDDPKDVGRYGLAPPEATVTVWTSASDQPQRLFIGAALQDSAQRHGRIEGRAAVVRLPEMVGSLITKTLDAFITPPPAGPEPAPTSAQ